MSGGDSSSRPANRLAGETSPYLRLHAHNPVDWFPWGDEALARARDEDKPIFLSVGYSTCYWCHVMERESFSDPAIAERMNASFVNIKVDREERPELDEIYMTATQVLTGQGGWPNSVFLTPRLEPFFAGTYFPPEDHYGRPGFPRVLASMEQAWRGRRDDVEEQAASVAQALRHHLEERGEPAGAVPGPQAAERSLADLADRFDEEWAGFGAAPKFPTPGNLFLLEAMAGRSPRAAEMLRRTLDEMARGGIYDQLAGGFHRYATDREWKVPHFEKMLYDNALLIELYARQAARDDDPQAARVAREIGAWMEREMLSPEGGLWSAQDAETDGDEGAFYVWTRDALRDVLGEEDFGFLAPIYGFDGAPFFEGGRYVLHLPRPLAEQAARRQIDLDRLREQVEPLRARLLAARARRPRPATDDKILADWNGMAIAGLAEAGRALDDAWLLGLAERAAAFVLSDLRPGGGPLHHVWSRGEARIPAFLADYVHLVRGCLALHRAGADGRWLDAALELAEEQERRLADPEGGFFTAAEAPDVLVRSRELFDGALPGANAVAALNALDLFGATGERRWRASAESALRAFASRVERVPEAARTMALAAWRFAAEAGSRRAATGSPAAPVTGRLELAAGGPDGWRAGELVLRIAEGWHVGGPEGSELVSATEVGGRGLEVEAEPPAAAECTLSPGGPAVAVWEGEVRIPLRVRVAGGGGAVTVAYQACDDRRCLRPAELELPVAPG